MKKHTLLNQPLSAVIAGMGHTDTLVVADAGLPIPASTQRIDLALEAGVPPFLETVRVILSEFKVERAIIADEMLIESPKLAEALRVLLGPIPIDTVSHEQFKERTESSKATVRTGEVTPYANVILISGVVF